MGLGSGLCGIHVSERPMGHPRALQGPTLSQIIKTNNMTQLAMSASLCVKVVVCVCVCDYSVRFISLKMSDCC